MSEIASGFVSLLPSARGFAASASKQLDPELDRAGRSGGKRLATGMKSSLGGAAKSIVAPLAAAFSAVKVVDFFRDSIDEARESQKVGALTTRVIKSTGGAARVTAAEVGNLATSISKKVGIDDEAIQSGENLLLTFKNVRNETGRGNRIFDRASRVMVDLAAGMAAASNGEVNFRSATTLVGKALNDPIKGISALSRVGVTFTEKQKATIGALIKGGKTMRAQKIILKELNSEFGGAAASQATAGAKFKVAFLNLEESIGTKLLPTLDKVLTKGADFINDADQWGPKLEETLKPLITGAEDGVKAMKPLGTLAVNITKWFNRLPKPVKSTAVQAAVLALVLPKVTNGLYAAGAGAASFGRSMLVAETRMAAVASMSYKLGVGIRNAAGVGGLLALQDSSKRTSGALKTLEAVGGTVAMGFAVGGPWGAVAGGAGAVLVKLFKAARRSSDEFKVSKQDVADYASTLDHVTGSATSATRSLTLLKLSKSGALSAGLKAGVSQRTLVDATLGKPRAILQTMDAIDRLNGKVKALTAEQREAKLGTTVGRGAAVQGSVNYVRLGRSVAGAKKQVRALTTVLGPQQAAMAKAGAKARLNYAATAPLGTLLKGFPKKAVTEIRADGIKRSMTAVEQLSATYKLTPKQIKTVAALAGFDVTTRQARTLVSKMTHSGEDASTGMNRGLRKSGQVSANMNQFIDSVTGGTRKARGQASVGGFGVGRALKSGVLKGFAGTAAALAGAAGSAVSLAINTAKKRADAHSPSREMAKIGTWMGQGLVIGMRSQWSSAASAGGALSLRALKAGADVSLAVPSITSPEVRVADAVTAAERQGRGPGNSGGGFQGSVTIDGEEFSAYFERQFDRNMAYVKR